MADSKLQFQPKTKGDYILQVANAFPFGGPFNYYRLTMGKLPSISNVFPLGIERGKASEFVLSGVNLDQLRRVSLGSAKLPGTIVEAQPGQARVRFQVPTEFPTGITALHFASEKNDFTAGISVLVSDTPESISTAARVRTAPQRIDAPSGVSGVIAKNRAADFYEFDAKAGEQLAIELHGASIGSEIDPAILLYDASGRVLVFQDEPVPWYFTEPPSADPYLVHRFEQAGRYLLAVRDSAHNGGPGYFYHLSIRPAAPDFRLVLNKPAATLYRGRKNTLTVRVKRFGGWDTPVEVWAEADNGAFQQRNGVAEPKNSTVTDCNAKQWQLDGTDVELELEIPANARAGDIPIRIRGRGVDRDGRIVERTLTSLYYPGFSGPRMGTVQYQDLYTTITDLPPLILDVPQNFNLVAGKTEKLRINVNRYDEGKESRRVIIEDLPPGVTVEPFDLPANSDVIELKLTAAKEAKAGTYLMRVKTGDIVTPKIELKINPAPEKKP